MIFHVFCDIFFLVYGELGVIIVIDGSKYNDGNVHMNFFDKSKDELVNIADEFSEGNLNLKNTLLTLWSSNIQTIACCIGHEDRYP